MLCYTTLRYTAASFSWEGGGGGHPPPNLPTQVKVGVKSQLNLCGTRTYCRALPLPLTLHTVAAVVDVIGSCSYACEAKRTVIAVHRCRPHQTLRVVATRTLQEASPPSCPRRTPDVAPHPALYHVSLIFSALPCPHSYTLLHTCIQMQLHKHLHGCEWHHIIFPPKCPRIIVPGAWLGVGAVWGNPTAKYRPTRAARGCWFCLQ